MHAYLILAHNEYAVLARLVACLDDPRNEIFVHFDKKTGDDLPRLECRKARLHILSDRVAVYWGDYSMVRAELLLFQAALQRGPFAYYHLLSGVDLPLKSQDEIHAFFARNAGKEFIGYAGTVETPELEERMHRWYPFPKSFQNGKPFAKRLNRYSIALQRRLGIRCNRDIEYRKGPQWVSVTEDMVRYLLSRRDWIRQAFRHKQVPDESLFQTLCRYSPMKDKVFDPRDEETGSQRKVNWTPDGIVADWARKDYGILKESRVLFARKFNAGDDAFLDSIIALQKDYERSDQCDRSGL